MKGKFITLEGPDGCGKSTIMGMVEKYLKEKDINFIRTREPGGTDISEKIRDLILDEDNKEMCPETEALLYAASRSQHVNEKILPKLDSGVNVFCERYLLSSLAYQGLGRGLGVKEVKMINDFATNDLIPDMILFFDVDPTVTLKRKTKNGGDRLEQEGDDFHKEVYEGYKKLLKMYPENVVIIDASQEILEVYNDTISSIEKLISRGEDLI